MAPEDVCPTCGRKKPGRRKGSKNEKRWTLKNIVGVSSVPAEAAEVAIKAIALAKSRGEISDTNAWQLLFELLPADYLASE
jgi:hypothetical protein